MTFLKTIGRIILGLGLAISGALGYHSPLNNLGSTLPSSVPAVFETYLANQQGTGDTTMTLANGTLRDGSSLTGYVCFTVDSNSTSLEYECGTAAGPNVTNIVRGIDAVTGTTTISSLTFAHRLGADVKITDYPILTILTRMANGNDSFPNLMQYDPSVLITNAAPTTTIATKYYVDNVAVSGAPNANTTTKGIVQLATGAQLAAGTANGSTGAALVAASTNATSTCQSAANSVLVTLVSSGKLSTGCIDQTQAYSWTGKQNFSTATSTFNATTSIAAKLGSPLLLNGVNQYWPTADGASSTVPMTDGSGNISWNSITHANSAVVVTATSTTSTGTVSVQGSTIILSTGANRVMITYAGSGSNSSTGDGINLGFSIDGTDTFTDASLTSATGGNKGNLSFSYVTTPLTLGSHTFVLRMQAVTGGTANIDGGSFAVTEIK